MNSHAPLFRRIDHLIIRVNEPNYSRLMAVFHETFGLHQPWPVSQHPLFKSGGIFAGNVDLELMEVRVGESASARIFGIEYELCDWEGSLQEMKRRHLPHVAIPYTQQSPDGVIDKWLNVFYKDMVGSNLWMKAYFAIMRLVSENTLRRLGSGDSADNAQAVDFVFNRVYRNGAVLAVKYNPAWRDIDAERRESEQQHRANQGGALGLVGVQEIVVGARQFERTRQRWQALFSPEIGSDNCWQIGDGPAVRLVPAQKDAILYMVWKVKSLKAARDFLSARQMLGLENADGLHIAPEAVFGLDIRLVE